MPNPVIKRAAAAFVLLLAAALLLVLASARAWAWEASERTAHYTVSGATGIALYRSIGDKGPELGPTRAIAHTTWDLKWRRDYQPNGTACQLRSAKPFLVLTYTLPKPAGQLPPALAARWKVFADGIAAHEKVHGVMIRAMVDEIIAATVGVHVENDAGCKKIRGEVLDRVKAAYADYRAKSRAFDRTEMSGGGNVHQLILGLVNEDG